MEVMSARKDGGPDSKVHGLFIFAWKKACSVILLHFRDGSREMYHSHAFNAISWVLAGKITENRILGESTKQRTYSASLRPIITTRDNLHKVVSTGDTWVLTFRGPWRNRWFEQSNEGLRTVLTHGRIVVK